MHIVDLKLFCVLKMLRLCINYFYEVYWFAGEPVSVPQSGSGARHGGDPAGTKVFAREYPNSGN